MALLGLVYSRLESGPATGLVWPCWWMAYTTDNDTAVQVSDAPASVCVSQEAMMLRLGYGRIEIVSMAELELREALA